MISKETIQKVEQIQSLAKTAIRRKSPSLPMKAMLKKGWLLENILDFGCGHGFDADYINADKYDPYYFPNWPLKLYDTIICIFVLNVLPTDEDRQNVIFSIQSLLKNDGVAYIAVHSDKRLKNNESNSIITIDTECIYHHNGIKIFKITKDQKCQAKKILL